MTRDRARRILDALRRTSVAVAGDYMRDRYIWGAASRISPEAPVPVVAVDRETAEPGGAANVLRTLATLGVSAHPFGVVGADAAGDRLRGLVGEFAAEDSGLICVEDRPTTQKTRVLAANQQIVRIDREESTPLPDEWAEKLFSSLAETFSSRPPQALIIEDYAKGVITRPFLSRLVEWGRGHDVFMALDPHPAHAFDVQGISVVTPNRAEAFQLAGAYHRDHKGAFEDDHELRRVVSALEEHWKPQRLLVTLGANGMALFQGGVAALHVPTKAREVFDVSGAGDTVIAVFTAAMAAGASAEEGAILANHAASVVVGKLGTAPVYREEILETFEI